MTDQFPPPPANPPQDPQYPQPVPVVAYPTPYPLAPSGGPHLVAVPQSGPVRPFVFDGGAATYLGTRLLGLLITVLTVGIAYPFALVLVQRWKAKHTYIEGRRLVFTGTGLGLFGNWIKWLLLMIVTFGIYSFWVVPRMVKWTVEHQAFDPTHRPVI